MLDLKPKFPFQITITIILTLGLSISFQSLLAAWTAPTVAPPGGTILLPVYNSGTTISPIINSELTVNDNFIVGTNKLYVNKTTGNVGIGTTNPAKNLEISQSTDGAILRITSKQNNATHVATNPFGSIEFYSDDASGAGVGVRGAIRVYPSSNTGGGSNMTFSSFGTGGENEAMRINYLGNVGIGTISPNGKLTIRSNANYTPLVVAGGGNPGVEIARFYNANDAESMRIDSDGNVGIGATDPSQKLDVAGKIRMRTQTAGTDTDDTVATKKYVDDNAGGGVYVMSCAIAPNGYTYGGLVCCRMNKSNGGSYCRIEVLNLLGSSVWQDYPYGNPFSNTTAGDYDITCTISSSGNFAYGGLVCCRLNKNSGSSECKISAVGLWGWNTYNIGSPF